MIKLTLLKELRVSVESIRTLENSDPEGVVEKMKAYKICKILLNQEERN